jgi:hypothetical protein
VALLTNVPRDFRAASSSAICNESAEPVELWFGCNILGAEAYIALKILLLSPCSVDISLSGNNSLIHYSFFLSINELARKVYVPLQCERSHVFRDLCIANNMNEKQTHLLGLFSSLLLLFYSVFMLLSTQARSIARC